MSLSIHLNFNGQCQEAFEFYSQQLGADISFMLKFKDSPARSEVPSAWQNKIVHANITIDKVEIAGADVLPEHYDKPDGCYLLLSVDSESKVKEIFDKLSPKGEVIMQPQKTFWSPCYAIVVDRFGIPWKINCGS